MLNLLLRFASKGLVLGTGGMSRLKSLLKVLVCEMESVSLDGADGSNAGNVSDDADVGTDADGDDVENIENGFSTENNAAGTSTHHDTDPPRITAAKLISNLAKNRTLAFKIIENVLGQTNR
jgi:hypothetical protein